MWGPEGLSTRRGTPSVRRSSLTGSGASASAVATIMEAMLIRCISPLARSAKHTGCSAPSALFSHRHARKVRAARARILLDRGDDLGAQCTGALAPGERNHVALVGRISSPRLVLEIDIGELLSGAVRHDEGSAPRRRSAPRSTA